MERSLDEGTQDFVGRTPVVVVGDADAATVVGRIQPPRRRSCSYRYTYIYATTAAAAVVVVAGGRGVLNSSQGVRHNNQ